MLPPLLVFILLLAFACSAPVNSEVETIHDAFQSYFERFHNDGHNISRTERIFAEESKRLGVTPHEHALACKEPTLNYIQIFAKISPKGGESSIFRKIDAIASSFPKTSPTPDYSNVNTTSEVIDMLKEVAPKLFDILNEEFNSYMSKLDTDAKNFIIQTGEQVVVSALKISSLKNGTEELVEERTKAVAMIDKQVVAYKALSQSAKDSIDRVFCTRTIMRMIGNECGDSSRWLTVIKLIQNWEENVVYEGCPSD